MAAGARYCSEEDWRRTARVCREAIALRPNEPRAYANLGLALSMSGHYMEAAKWFLEAKKRYPMDSEYWAEATANAFHMLVTQHCDGDDLREPGVQAVKPEWWNDEGLKALS